MGERCRVFQVDSTCKNLLIVSLGLVAQKEEEREAARLSRAGSYRASLRYYTNTFPVSARPLSCTHFLMYNIHLLGPDCASKENHFESSIELFHSRTGYLHLRNYPFAVTPSPRATYCCCSGTGDSSITAKIRPRRALKLKNSGAAAAQFCISRASSDRYR